MQLNRHWQFSYIQKYTSTRLWFIPSSETLSEKKTKNKDKIAGNVTLVFYELDITVL